MVEERPSPTLQAAYDHCAQVTRRSGSSFAAAFWMLSPPRRRALHAVYAFCRLADDIADDPAVRGDRAKLLARWRAELRAAYEGTSQHPVGVAISDAVRRFQLPEEIFLDLLRGVESWASDPEKDGRATAFRNYRLVNVENAGHWVHHDRLKVFLDTVREFLGEEPA